VQTPPALDVLGLFRWAKKGVAYHDDGRDSGASHGENKFPVCKKRFQLAISGVQITCGAKARARSGILALTPHKKTPPTTKIPTGVYFTETAAEG
jgi:hypothetical protein